MRRFLLSIGLSLITSIIYANNVEVIYKGPRYIGDWETIELSSIKFHDLEIGDTIYVYATKTDSTSLGAFQNHKWDTLDDAMNGDVITGDFEMIVDTETKLSEIKQFGLKVRGVNYECTIKMEYVDDKGQKQATSTGVAAGQNYVQMAIPEGITQLDRVYLTYQNPGSLKLTEASVVTTGEARSRGFINDGVTTSIKDVKRGADMSDKWYDMNGRQVEQPSKGLYIKNGKKIMHH